MSLYSEALDILVTRLSDAVGVPVTRDPGVIGPLLNTTNTAGLLSGAIFVGFPTSVGRTQGGANLEVPVTLVAPAPADLNATNWLLDYYDIFVETCGHRNITVRPFVIGEASFPAVSATVQILIGSE